MRTKTKKLAALVMSGVMTLSIAAPVAVQADDKVAYRYGTAVQMVFRITEHGAEAGGRREYLY